VTHRVIVAPAAALDVVEIALHVASEQPDAAARFFDAIFIELRDRLAEQPDMGAPADDLLPGAGLRRLLVPGFRNYLAFYRVVTESEVQIVRIVHGGRDLPRALARN
jgi:plasmid stabilization system protein ParE